MADLNDNEQRLGRRARKAAGVLVVGALGSGLWSRVFEPLLSLLVRVAARTSSSYRDNIYFDVSNGFHEVTSMMGLEFLVVGALMLLLYNWSTLPWPKAAQAHTRSRFDGIEARISLKSWILMRRIGWGLALLAAAVVVLGTARLMFINQVVIHSLKSIEILAPYVDEHERLMLRSKFSSIESGQQYRAFYGEMGILAQKHGVLIRMIKPL